jgi:hypothetical protein
MWRSPLNKLVAIIAKGITWAFAGALCGALFMGIATICRIVGLPEWSALLLACAGAGTVTAAFFGSMLVALGGTLAGILVAISHEILAPNIEQPWLLLAAAFVIALVAGTIFTRQEVAQAKPLGQAGSGLVAGLVAGLLLGLIAPLTGLSNDHWGVSALAVALVGLLYVVASFHMPGMLNRGPLLMTGAPLVSGIIGVAVAGAFWFIGESMLMLPQLTPGRFHAVLAHVPPGLIGGLVGGGIGGAMLELLGIRVEAHIS